jgi:hypothetical protein
MIYYDIRNLKERRAYKCQLSNVLNVVKLWFTAKITQEYNALSVKHGIMFQGF